MDSCIEQLRLILKHKTSNDRQIWRPQKVVSHGGQRCRPLYFTSTLQCENSVLIYFDDTRLGWMVRQNGEEKRFISKFIGISVDMNVTNEQPPQAKQCIKCQRKIFTTRHFLLSETNVLHNPLDIFKNYIMIKHIKTTYFEGK